MLYRSIVNLVYMLGNLHLAKSYAIKIIALCITVFFFPWQCRVSTTPMDTVAMEELQSDSHSVMLPPGLPNLGPALRTEPPGNWEVHSGSVSEYPS